MRVSKEHVKRGDLAQAFALGVETIMTMRRTNCWKYKEIQGLFAAYKRAKSKLKMKEGMARRTPANKK